METLATRSTTRSSFARPVFDSADGWTDLRYVPDAADDFSREPAFACFVALHSGGVAGTDFLFAIYHARWAEGDTADIQDEVESLPSVFSAMSAARPTERDLIISGDFNLVPIDLTEAISRPIDTSGSGSTMNSTGNVTTNVYDHIIASDPAATSEMLGPASIVDVRGVSASNRVFFQTVSDHLPIVVKLKVGADDD